MRKNSSDQALQRGRTPVNSDPRRSMRSEGVARTRDGTRIEYRIHDRGPQSPRAVLIHSLAMDREFWARVADLLDASVLTYGCRGHGASDRPAGPSSVSVLALSLACLWR